MTKAIYCNPVNLYYLFSSNAWLMYNAVYRPRTGNMIMRNITDSTVSLVSCTWFNDWMNVSCFRSSKVLKVSNLFQRLCTDSSWSVWIWDCPEIAATPESCTLASWHCPVAYKTKITSLLTICISVPYFETMRCFGGDTSWTGNVRIILEWILEP